MSALSAPIILQASNGILDKSKVKDSVKIYVKKYEDISKGDTITLHFMNDKHPFHIDDDPDNLPDPFQIAEYSIAQIPDSPAGSPYQVFYTADHIFHGGTRRSDSLSLTVISGDAIQPPEKKEKTFTVMGARSILYTSANALFGPQCLTAWDEEGNPVSVTWQYRDTPKANVSWQYNDENYHATISDHFYDNAPDIPIVVTSLPSGKYMHIINPINIFGNGGTAACDNPFGETPSEKPVGVPESFASSFAALTDSGTLYAWGAIEREPKVTTGGLTDSNVKKVVASGYGYGALHNDGSITLWSTTTSMHMLPPQQAQSKKYIDLTMGGLNVLAMTEDGNIDIWGMGALQQPSVNLGPAEKTILVGNDDAVFGFNTETQHSLWLRMDDEVPNGWLGYSYSIILGRDYSSPRAIVPAGCYFTFIHKDGTAELLTFAAPIPPKFDGIYPIPGDSAIQSVNPSEWDILNGENELNIIENVRGRAILGTDNKLTMTLNVPPNPPFDFIKTYDNITDISGNYECVMFRTQSYKAQISHNYNINTPSKYEPPSGCNENIVQVTCTANACAALHKDGTVTAWGESDFGGDCTNVKDQLKDVRAIYATGRAFAALTADKRVVTWGYEPGGGNNSEANIDNQISYSTYIAN
ncbi:hypothetical protein ID853_09945 [Xenorhabdus sp. Vera]|uniref:hypothetical protein n=1 Tax=Xenorhabdus koppenhoeferi TaxID=351659 RepID=UPI00198FBCDB|nr:hypothetical protein [Xenorhabdus sp. Vera]MBD2811192.1 hypothetical protein [Xenorhabdus sp. Vera]